MPASFLPTSTAAPTTVALAPTVRAPPAAASPLEWGSILPGLARLLGSHGIAALSGLISLPILTRRLAPEEYGVFSLFLTLLAVVAYQDFLRPLLVRELVRDAEQRARLLALARVVGWILAVASGVLAACFVAPVAALAFSAAILFFTWASPHFAWLSLHGRAAQATAIRNYAFAAATLLVTAGVVVLDPAQRASIGIHLFVWPFVLANAAIWILYVRMSNLGAERLPAPGTLGSARQAWSEHRAAILTLVGFGLATALVVLTDRAVMEKLTDPAEFGRYVGIADLNAKLTLFGTALGTLLYPQFVRGRERDVAGAERDFVRIASHVVCVWFVFMAGLILCSRPLVALLLGPRFVLDSAPLAWLFAATFVHMLGFLVTPWQRARGEFAVQTRAYAWAGTAVLVVSLALVPWIGALGAAIGYSTARAAEIALVCYEARRISPSVLSRRRLGVWAGMALTLFALAAFQIGRAA